jgi:hypothetical protein
MFYLVDPYDFCNGDVLQCTVHVFCTKCSRPARENVMNAHGETCLFLVVVNQPKIQ